MATHNNRKHKRIPLKHEAMIFVGGKLTARCRVLDISATGARLALDREAIVPNEFMLSLARMGQVYRGCQLVWRSDTEAGVAFHREI
jgi:hypothetical protein